MKINVQGVTIELTIAQINQIEKAKKARKRNIAKQKDEKYRYEAVLFNFQFKKVDTTGWENPDQLCYEHPYYNWFAIIQKNFSGDIQSVWLVGQGLKCGGFPGGWSYWDPEELEKAISKALDKLQNQDDN